jgi:choline kinase
MLQEIVDSKIIVDPIITKGLWMEIDTTEDLKRAENLFKN